MNNTERIRHMEAKLKQCDQKLRTLTAQIRRMKAGTFPNNIHKGRFTIRRLQNEYPGMLMRPRNRV